MLPRVSWYGGRGRGRGMHADFIPVAGYLNFCTVPSSRVMVSTVLPNIFFGVDFAMFDKYNY